MTTTTVSQCQDWETLLLVGEKGENTEPLLVVVHNLLMEETPVLCMYRFWRQRSLIPYAIRLCPDGHRCENRRRCGAVHLVPGPVWPPAAIYRGRHRIFPTLAGSSCAMAAIDALRHHHRLERGVSDDQVEDARRLALCQLRTLHHGSLLLRQLPYLVTPSGIPYRADDYPPTGGGAVTAHNPYTEKSK
jgi:hypothetical protein